MCCSPNVFERSKNIQLMGELGFIALNLCRPGRIFKMNAYRRLCRQRRNQMSEAIGLEQMNLSLMLTDLYANLGSCYRRMNSFNIGEQNRCLFLPITEIATCQLEQNGRRMCNMDSKHFKHCYRTNICRVNIYSERLLLEALKVHSEYYYENFIVLLYVAAYTSAISSQNGFS